MSDVAEVRADGPLAELVQRVRASRERVLLTTADGGEAFVISREDLEDLERADSAWFWDEAWQAGEREADADIAAGRGEFFGSTEEFINALRTR